MTAVSCPQETGLARDEVLQQLERILLDRRFASSERNAGFLRYVVNRTLAGRANEIKEVVIATELYGRSTDYDPKVDSIVRVEAPRLRSKLQSYYEQDGRQDPIRITIPRGTYVPQFERTVPPEFLDAEPENTPSIEEPVKRPRTVSSRRLWTASAILMIAGVAGLWSWP